jgi:hypothetical protein
MNILLKGPCRGGLYPLPSSFAKIAFEANKVGCEVVKPSLDRWHSRLGHASIPIVQRVIRDSNLPCLAQEIKDSVCNACQQGKRHQLFSLVCPNIPSNLSFLMFGGQLLIQLVVTNFMWALLMISINLLEYILSNLNMRYFRNFMSFRIL